MSNSILTKVENMSYISCSVYNPEGFCLVFNGRPHWKTWQSDFYAEIDCSNGNLTILSAAQWTDVAFITLTMSTYVPGTPSYFHERSLIYCMTLSRYHIRYLSREFFSGKRAWRALKRWLLLCTFNIFRHRLTIVLSASCLLKKKKRSVAKTKNIM